MKRHKVPSVNGSAHLKLVGFVLDVLSEPLTQNGLRLEDLATRIAEKHSLAVPSVPELEKALKPIEPLLMYSRGRIGLCERKERTSFFTSRAKTAQMEKRAVAAHIHDHILNELDAIFLDGGSANVAIAEEMALGNKGNFTVLTNNMRAARTLMANPTIRVFLTGGFYDVQDEALMGKSAMFETSRFTCKFAIVGASALTDEYVYNHAIAGEEEIKSFFWRIPADELIVPATLSKFRGRDASAFGRLKSEGEELAAHKLESGQEETIFDQALNALGLAIRNRRSNLATNRQHDVPGFVSERCTIVIEPEWMIQDVRKACAGDVKRINELDRLWETVQRINQNSSETNVEVVFAQISREVLGWPQKTGSKAR